MNTKTISHALIDAFNRRDLSQWRELLAEDFRAEYPGEKQLNADQARAYNQAFLDAFSDLRFHLHESWELGPLTVLHWTASGRQSADLRTRDRILISKGKTATISGVFLVDQHRGRLTRERSYWDRLELLESLS